MWSTLLSVVLVINELMASNAGQVISPAINYDSWIEVYNPSNQAVNLGNMYLSNDANDLTLWRMPSNMGTVPAKGFKVIWLGSGDINKLQAPFKLDCDGGTIYLSDANGSLITSEKYPEALSRTAWARTTDGEGGWSWTATPTPGESNATATFANKRLNAPVVSVGSKLFTSSLTVNVTIPQGARLMYTTDGSMPGAPRDTPMEDPWKQQVKNGNCEGDDASCFPSKDGDVGKIENHITDGVGVDNSRGVTVHAIKGAKNDNTSQFFVYTPDHIWQTGERFRFTMKVRADRAAKIKAFAQKKPGEPIEKTNWSWSGGSTTTPVSILASQYNVTTQWTEISCEGIITADQADEQYDWGGGWWGGGSATVTYALQTIAFSLNIDKNNDNDFYFDEISWESIPADYTEDPTKESTDGKFTVNETTNYTFRLYQDGYLPSVPVTRSYIKTSNKYTLPIISIVGDPKDFTDPKIGFDCEGDGTNGITGNGQSRKMNYNCDWDRPANFSFLSPDGEMLFNQDVNICVSGGFTRSQRFRSFKLKSNKIYDGQNRLDYAFFPQKPYNRNKVLLIRNGGNDIWRNNGNNSRFMDPALETIIQRSGIDIDVQSYVPIIEYVNGELRGVFNMREPNNDKFAYANFGYDDEELDAMENNTIKNGSDEVMQRIYELGKKINEEGVYEELKTLLDIDEYTNYMAATLFLHNDDWPDNNIKCYRSQNDGRFRFVSFDLDYSFKACWPRDSKDNPFDNFAMFKDTKTAPRESKNIDFVNFFLNMLNHDGYRKKFIDTFCLMGGSVFEPTRSSAIVDELLNKVKAMCQLMKNQEHINDGHDPQNAANEIKNNLKGRSKKMTDYMKKFSQMKLSNITQQSVNLSTDTEGANIYVNGLEVPYADFQGHLFAPVTLEAKAPAGYKFTGWKDGDEVVSTSAEMELPEDATISLVACFEPLSDQQRLAQGITPVRINEISAANSIYANEYWKRNDWVELYNTTDKAIDVAGMYLSDNINKPKKYQIAADGISTVIPAHGYLIVWCDKLYPESQLHAEFKLASEGGDVLLTAADESWCDHFVYTEHKGDETVGRYPDGAPEVYVMNIPTIAKSNIMSSYLTAVEQPVITGIRDLMAEVTEELSIRYAAGCLAIRSTQAERLQVRIANLAGQSVATLPVELTGGATEISVEQLPTGVYVAVITDQQGHKATCKFVKR